MENTQEQDKEDKELQDVIKKGELNKIMATKKINLYPKKELREVIVKEAQKVDRSINKFCLMLLQYHLIDKFKEVEKEE